MMDYSFEPILFLIVVGLVLAIVLLGLGICLGREYERLSKRKSHLYKGNNDMCTDTDSNTNSAVGNIHG